MDVLNKQKEKLKGALSDKAGPSQPAIEPAALADLVEKPAEKPADKPAEVRVKPDPKKIAIEWLKFRPIWSFLGVVFVAWLIGKAQKVMKLFTSVHIHYPKNLLYF